MLSEFSSLAAVARDEDDFIDESVAPGRPLRVLIADDDATNRKILRTILVSAGHACVSVKDGEEALHELVTSRYDAAVIDMHMPKRDGVEVVKLYKFSSFNELSPTPIVMFTADATLAARKHATEAGVDRFLTKPVKPAVLLQVIYTAAKGARAFERAGPEGPKQITRNSTVVPMVRQTTDPVTDSNAMIKEEQIADLLCFMSPEERIDFFSDFAEDAQGYAMAFQGASSSEEIAQAQKEMHSLAGAAVTVGAVDLAEMAKRIEKMPIDEVLRHHDALVPQLDALLEKTLAEIEDRYLNPTRIPGA
jgi:CheY-like chemotaxis protein/HPt (histidine-containing phosphotransfer) domain-containing protein